MPGKSNKLGQFWQELKRRRVIHVITVYASSTFILIELVNNLAEPLNLPARLPTIVVVVLAIGFPLAVILSWLYDLTSEGVEKTKPLSEIREGEKPAVPNAWKIATYVSFVVIIGLVVLNVLGGGKQLRAGDIQSLVILPFANYTGDDQLEYFVSGLHASLIQDMGRISGFHVVNRTTSNVYKNVDMRVHEIASELNADAAIEADVMCLGDTICLQVRVISAFPEEKTIWIADYKEEKSQILNLYNRITKQIADEVKIELTADEDRLLAESRKVNPDAYDAYLKGLFNWERLGKEDLERAREYFEMAIEIDPNWAPPYAGVSMAWGTLRFMGFVPDNIALPKKYQYLNKALELDPNSALSHYISAMTAVWTEFDWEKGEREFLKSLERNPNDALCRMYYAHLLMILRRNDEARYHAQLGLKLDPLKPLVLGLYGVLMRNEGDYQSAIAHFEKALSIDPNFGFAKGNLLQAYVAAGDYEKWFELWKKRVCWDDEVKTQVEKVLYEHGFVAAIEELLKLNEKFGKAGCQMNYGNKMYWYLQVNNCDKGLEYLEKLFENPFGGLAYVGTNNYGYDQLKEYPRYVEILRKMNLPLPED